MPSFEKKPLSSRQSRTEALDAVREGRAMPLPSFLEENRDARRIFSEALRSSEELRHSLKELSPEEKILFIKQFSGALDRHNTNTLNDIASKASYVSMGVGGALLAVPDFNSKIVGASALVNGISFNLGRIFHHISDEKERNTLKNLIIETVSE